MKALLIGYGSIGSRHARILKELDFQVTLVTKQEIAYAPRYSGIETALKQGMYDYAVVANETASHLRSLNDLGKGGFRGVVLVEKPIFDQYSAIPEYPFSKIFVGYNLRFHPVLQKLRNLLMNAKIFSVHAYVGQYLPTWRPDRDYRSGYWAFRSSGGGVLRELSHELDYLLWLLGGWSSVTAVGGHFSSLSIETDDIFTVLMKTEKCQSVTVHMNYLDQTPRREIIINTENDTVYADLMHGFVKTKSLYEKFSVDRDYTYRVQHSAILQKDFGSLCTAGEGLLVVKLIDAIEQASNSEAWLTNDAFVSSGAL